MLQEIAAGNFPYYVEPKSREDQEVSTGITNAKIVTASEIPEFNVDMLDDVKVLNNSSVVQQGGGGADVDMDESEDDDASSDDDDISDM